MLLKYKKYIKSPERITLSSKKVSEKKTTNKQTKKRKKQACCAIQEMKIYPVDSEQPRPEVNWKHI